MIKDKKSIIVLNKIDLEQNILTNQDEEFKKYSKNIVKISALKNKGIEDLYNKITEIFNLNEINVDNDIVITNIRHKNLISKAIDSVLKAEETIKNEMPIDVVAIFLKDILENLGNITGDEVTEDIINDIFSKFCLGK
jgi:tRNA modification GTPase